MRTVTRLGILTIRMLRAARRSAVKARTGAGNPQSHVNAKVQAFL